MKRTHASQGFLGFVIVLLFMTSVSIAFGASTSPPAIIDNGNSSAIVATPNDQIVHTNAIMDATNAGYNFDVAFMVTTNSGADLKVDLANLTPAQITFNIASTADKTNTSGQNVDGANLVMRNAAITDGSLQINANSSVDNTFKQNVSGIILTNGSNGADAQQLNSEVAFVLKIETSADATVYTNGLADYVMAPNFDLSGTATNVLKKPINSSVANTGAPTSNSVLSTMNSAIYTLPASGITNTAIEYSIVLSSGQQMNNQAKNQENTSANDLVADANNNLLAASWTAGNTGTDLKTGNTPTVYALNTSDATTDATMTRPPTTSYNAEMNAMGIVGAGLALNFA